MMPRDIRIWEVATSLVATRTGMMIGADNGTSDAPTARGPLGSARALKEMLRWAKQS